MKRFYIIIFISTTFFACSLKTESPVSLQHKLPLTGTWKLISGTIIENGKTTVTDYTTNLSFIKIINDSHFAFLKHDLTHGKDKTADFGSGGGSYTLKDSTYTEHLEYCNAREWEGNDFSFTVTIKKDTLIQSGIEKIEKAGVNRINIEKYYRLK